MHPSSSAAVRRRRLGAALAVATAVSVCPLAAGVSTAAPPPSTSATAPALGPGVTVPGTYAADGTSGRAGYKVADDLQRHRLHGGGVHGYQRNAAPGITTERGLEVPGTPGVRLHHVMTVHRGERRRRPGRLEQ